MGLDVSHDCWSGAYSGFSRFRDKLATVAGYEFIEDVARGGRTMVALDYGSWPDANYYDPPIIPFRADGTPDPLLLLLMHSDCEGRIRAEHVGALADRLTALLPDIEGDGHGHVGDYREATQQFINGLRMAELRNEDVVFS